MIQLMKYFGLIGTNFEILMLKIVIEQAIKFPLVCQMVGPWNFAKHLPRFVLTAVYGT